MLVVVLYGIGERYWEYWESLRNWGNVLFIMEKVNSVMMWDMPDFSPIL